MLPGALGVTVLSQTLFMTWYLRTGNQIKDREGLLRGLRRAPLAANRLTRAETGGRPQALASFTCAMSALGTWGKRNAAMSVCALRREAEVGLGLVRRVGFVGLKSAWGLVRRVGATDAQAKVDLGVSEPGPMSQRQVAQPLSRCRRRPLLGVSSSTGPP